MGKDEVIRANPERVLQLMNAMIDGLNAELLRHDDRKLADLFMAAHNMHMHVLGELIDDVTGSPESRMSFRTRQYLWAMALETFGRDCERAIRGEDWREESDP